MAAKSFVRRARRAAAQNELPFWKCKTLAQMSKGEWEALCDGCGMCCVNKLEYEGTGELAQTDTCCKLLDPRTARCRDYKNRKKIVPEDRKSTRLNSSHDQISYAVFCLKKK